MTNYDMPDTFEKLPSKICVVVGNGYAIKNHSLGNTINNYDIVIRLNDAPVKGYEEDVGNKTSIRLFYPESAPLNPTTDNDPDTLMVLVPFKVQDIKWINGILYNEKRTSKGFWKPPTQIWQGEKRHLRILDPYFMQKTASHLLHLPLNAPLKSYPTTGMLAIYVALNYCDLVHIAGFGYPSSKEERHLIHYYGSDVMKAIKKSFHNFSSEEKTLQKLKDSGAIKYLHPHYEPIN
ncbi:CMP-N-acetylneuraminate-beta-galactosamide-alpha-2,3-sialyltransferase 4-like [Aplochiton taeniatus]